MTPCWGRSPVSRDLVLVATAAPFVCHAVVALPCLHYPATFWSPVHDLLPHRHRPPGPARRHAAGRGENGRNGRNGSDRRDGERREGRQGEQGGRRWWIGSAVVLAGFAYVPFLAVRPGVVTPDTKTYLYLDPLRFLSQVAFMWNPTVGLGTVTHEYIGYLLPMGPFFAVFHLLGVPVWVAQRLWLGSILFAAGLGVLYVSRILGLRGPGPGAAALMYMLSPYFLQYAGRISVILLPWAGLPFMLGLTIVALRRGGWREPALFAFVVALVSGINASSIIYVGVGPLLWILYAVVVLRESTWRHALATVARIGVLTLGACLWWIAGLEVEAAYGVNVLKFTETVPSTSATSNPADIIRGLGYWYFYGSDHLGAWTNAAIRFTQNISQLATSYAVPVVAVVAAAFVRWREPRLFPRPPLRRPGALGRALSLLRPHPRRRLAEVVHDRHDGRVGAAFDRPGHAAGVAGPVHAARQWPDRALAPRLHRRSGDGGRRGRPGRRQHAGDPRRRLHRQQLHAAGRTALLPAGRHRPSQRHPSRHPGLRHPRQRLRGLPMGRHRRHAAAGTARP